MSNDALREVRERTGAAVAACVRALAEHEEDVNEAIRALVARGEVPAGREVTYAAETDAVLERRYLRRMAAGDGAAGLPLALLVAERRTTETPGSAFPRLLRAAAVAGVAEAQWRLGVRLLAVAGPVHGQERRAEAATWFDHAAQTGFKPARRMLGLLYRLGRGVPSDRRKADELMRAGAESGSTHTEDGFALGFIGRDARAQADEAEAFRWFELAAKERVAEGQLWLGLLHANTHSGRHDLAAAERLLRAAAEHRDGGLALAAYLLGRLRDRAPERPGGDAPQGGPWRDRAAACAWYRRAAEADLPEAMAALAERAEKGDGVPQDDVEAARWYHAAARRGVAWSRLESFVFHGRGVSAGEDEEVRRWRARAGPLADPFAMYVTGLLHQVGRGVPEDPVEAVRWYRSAADAGVGPAAFLLGAACCAGYGGARDPAEGARRLEQAVEARFECALLPLALLHFFGHGIPQNPERANALLDRAALAGHCVPLLRLADHVIVVDGVAPLDRIGEREALYWGLAAGLGFDVAQLLYGALLVEGRGVPADAPRGHALMATALRAGLPDPRKNRPRLRPVGPPTPPRAPAPGPPGPPRPPRPPEA